MFELLTQSSWADRIGWVLVHSLWQFALVALGAVAMQQALRRRSAAARYRALLAAMSLTVALPVATWFSPWFADTPVAAVTPRPIEKPEVASQWQHNSPPHRRGEEVAVPAVRAESPGELGVKQRAEPQRAEPARVGLASSWSLVKRRVQPWLPQIVLVWFAGVLLAAFRPLWGWFTVRRLKRVGISPVPDAVYGLLERTAKRLKVTRAVQLLQSGLVKTPVVVGYFRPAVLLPLSVLTGLPEPQLELILAHELAHIRRHDYLINVLQTLVETLFFYHPAVWWLSRQVRNERENCCDDLAMATVGSRADYGRALLAIEELRAASTALSLSARGGSLLARIRRIAGREPAPRMAGDASVLCVILVSLAICAAVAWAAIPAADKPEHARTGAEKDILQSTEKTTVTGQVVDSAGKPVAGAQVAVVGRPRKPSNLLSDELELLGLTKADQSGRFRVSIPKLSSAEYYDLTKVVAAAEGFNLGWQPIGEDVENPSVTVSLAPEQTIHGRVVDAKGQPAVGVKLCVTAVGRRLPGDFEGIKCWTPPSQLPFWPQPVTTDGKGRFTLRGVDRSQILNVQVRDDRFAIDWIQIGLAGAKDAHVTTDASGELTISPSPARILEGRVTYEDTHQPAANARVEIGSSTDPSRSIMNMAGLTDAQGRFRLNPYSGDIFYISVYPTDGQPYLSYARQIRLPAGQQPPPVQIALPRGVLLRGHITEKASGQPVPGAAVHYEEHSRPPYRPDRILPNCAPPEVRGVSGADGAFQIAVPPGRGTLFVQGPRGDYIHQMVNTWDFHGERNKIIAQRHYVGDYRLLEVKPNQTPVEVNLALRRGVTVRGSIVGPDDRPVGDVLMLSRHFIGMDESTWRGRKISVKNGQFELHGLDPDVSVPVHFLDPEHETGATAEISGRSADHGPLVVRLQPCGKAVARFVDRQGRPKVKYKYEFGLQILVSPGPSRWDEKRNRKEVCSDQDFVANSDRAHYWDDTSTGRVADEEGRCTFPALIPGATYRLSVGIKPGEWDEKDFSVSPGETLELPDVVVSDPESEPAAKPTAEVKRGVSAVAADANAWPPGQTFDVRFVNARTKEPLPGVKVESQFQGAGINFQDVKTYTTDAKGDVSVRLPDREPDTIRLYPTKAGFVPLRVYWEGRPARSLITKAVTVALPPGTEFGGVVRNEKGEPIPGATVTIHYWANGSGRNPHLRANLDESESAVTDKDGRWVLDVIPAEIDNPDDLRIYLSHPDYISDHLRRGYIPTPVTERPSIEALRARTAVMVMRKGGTAQGRVTDETGRPIAGVRLYDDELYWFAPQRSAATTDKDGRFRIANLFFTQSGINDPPPSTLRAIESREVALTLQAPGYSPVLVHIDPQGSAAPLEISLKPGRAVEGRVVDQAGKPLAGVFVSVSNWLGYRQRLHLETKADANGKFRLADAPLSGALYGFYKNGYMVVQDFPMSTRSDAQPPDEGYRVTLKTPLIIAGSILDAQTNQPLEKCKLIKGSDYEDGRSPQWETIIGFPARMIIGGRYEIEVTREEVGTRLRVEADGYMPAVSRLFKPYDPDQGRVIYDFRLSKAAPMSATVLGPDGKPLAGAEVFLTTRQFFVKNRKAEPYARRTSRMVKTDASGRFEFPPEVEPFYLVVLHDQGRLVLTEQQFADTPVIRVEPWTAQNQTFLIERRKAADAISAARAVR